jgi:hypothetical protein
MLPELNNVRRATSEITVFKGLNRTSNTGFSRVSTSSTTLYTEFKDMKNMSGDNFPILSPRKNRARVTARESARIVSNVICANDGLIYLDSRGYLCNNGRLIEIKGYEYDTKIEHQLVQYGNNVLIFPDKKYVNLSSGAVTDIEVHNNGIQCKAAQDSEYYGFYCSIDKIALNTSVKPRKKVMSIAAYINFADSSEQKGKEGGANYAEFISKIEVGDTIEECKSVPSKLWMCTSEETNTQYYNNKLKHFTEIASYYLKISADKIGAGLKVGDFVKISGIEHNVGEAEWDIGTSYVDTLNNKFFKLYDVANDYIVIKASIDSSVPYCGIINVERIMPDLETGMIMEIDNRLWGCSSKSNEIYACKLGDCENWYAYSDGIATDSFALTVGVEGEFTGIAKMNSSVIFFKENYALKIYGTKPSNFTLTTYRVSGVEKGSRQSVVNMGDYLLYKAKNGIAQYSGGTAVLISESAFGNEKYRNAVAGKHKSKYYVSLENIKGGNEMFCFDVQKGLWHKEDDTRMLCTATYNDTMYYVNDENNYIVCVESENSLLDNIMYYDTKKCGKEFEDGTGRIYGDVDDDGVVTADDLQLLKDYIAAEKELKQSQIETTDVNDDNSIDARDVTLLQTYLTKQKLEIENSFEWFCETGDMYDSDFDTKFISKVAIGIKPEKDTKVRVLARFSESGEWSELYRIYYDEKKPRVIPVPLRRAEFLRLKIEGVGYCEIYGINITYQKGSAVR